MRCRKVTAAAYVGAVVLLQASCDNIVDPPLPANARQFTPPAVYEVWWTMAEECVGRTGSFAAVKWYEAPAISGGVGGTITGYWSAGSNQIVLQSSMILNPRVVRHEMVHALLRSEGHPRETFVEACGGFVACSLGCLRDAGPGAPLDPGHQRVPPSEINVASTLVPLTPHALTNDGYFSFTVRATNVKSYPVVVTLAGMPGAPVLFSATLRGSVGAQYVVPPLHNEAIAFKPGETKQYVFDFFAGAGLGDGLVPPGHYTLTGAYGGKSAASQELVIPP